jgi:hypothetical protein
MVKVRLNCKECAREFVREVPDETVRAAEEGGIALTAAATNASRAAMRGRLKKLMRELQKERNRR